LGSHLLSPRRALLDFETDERHGLGFDFPLGCTGAAADPCFPGFGNAEILLYDVETIAEEVIAIASGIGIPFNCNLL